MSFLCIFGLFLRSTVGTEWVYFFFGFLNLKYFIGVLEIPDIFGG